MKICIITSLSNKELCENIVTYLESFGIEVYHPFLDQTGSLYKIQKRYLKAIVNSDLVLAIPKNSSMDESIKEDPKTIILDEFGESTSYEMAFARFVKKPIIIWGAGGVDIGNIKKDTDQ